MKQIRQSKTGSWEVMYQAIEIIDSLSVFDSAITIGVEELYCLAESGFSRVSILFDVC
jgi:hypothetical protein